MAYYLEPGTKRLPTSSADDERKASEVAQVGPQPLRRVLDEDGTPTISHLYGPSIKHVLPFRWSLFYALKRSEWAELRRRHRWRFLDYKRCKCPNGCRAKQFDEHWKYDYATFTKTFQGAEYICAGCHWLKSPPFRIRTWRQQEQGTLQAPTGTPHIIGCLEWTQAEVDSLRRMDLNKYRKIQADTARMTNQLQRGEATMAPAPIEQMPPQERDTLLASGKAVYVPWRIDLANLTIYGYSVDEIAQFEKRMSDLAAERMKDTGQLAAE